MAHWDNPQATRETNTHQHTRANARRRTQQQTAIIGRARRQQTREKQHHFRAFAQHRQADHYRHGVQRSPTGGDVRANTPRGAR